MESTAYFIERAAHFRHLADETSDRDESLKKALAARADDFSAMATHRLAQALTDLWKPKSH
jgi:hypothetical protein